MNTTYKIDRDTLDALIAGCSAVVAVAECSGDMSAFHATLNLLAETGLTPHAEQVGVLKTFGVDCTVEAMWVGLKGRPRLAGAIIEALDVLPKLEALRDRFEPAEPEYPTPLGCFRNVMAKVSKLAEAGKHNHVNAALAHVGLNPDELAPLVMPSNRMRLAAFNLWIDAALAENALVPPPPVPAPNSTGVYSRPEVVAS